MRASINLGAIRLRDGVRHFLISLELACTVPVSLLVAGQPSANPAVAADAVDLVIPRRPSTWWLETLIRWLRLWAISHILSSSLTHCCTCWA